MEAQLLTALHPDGPQGLVTLHATSTQEKPYADAVKQFVRQKRVPCVIGFTFLKGPLQGRPLLGRNLRDVTADFAAVEFQSDRLYDTLLVPQGNRHRIRLQDKGRRFAARYAKIVQSRSRKDLDRFMARLETVSGASSVGFGMLDFKAQRDLVGSARTRGFVHALTGSEDGDGSVAGLAGGPYSPNPRSHEGKCVRAAPRFPFILGALHQLAHWCRP